MNSNLIRTIIATAVVLLPIVVQFLGCTTNAVGVYDCSGSWIPANYLPYIMSGMTLLALLIKTFGGPSGATMGEKLAAPAVPVVPAEKAKVGVVTDAQVQAPGSSK